MLKQLQHMKEWSLQNQDALTKEQLCKEFAAMCDDAIAEYNAAQPSVQTDEATCPANHSAEESQASSGYCAVCGKPLRH